VGLANYVARQVPNIEGDAPNRGNGAVCQYENTSNGDFLNSIDIQICPTSGLAGGGSGPRLQARPPALGEYLAAQICGEGKSGTLAFSLGEQSHAARRGAVFL